MHVTNVLPSRPSDNSGKFFLVECREKECSGPHLTPRQTEVLRLASSGLSSKLIAHELSISKRTVDDHLSAARKKCGANNTEELIARCWAAGFFMIGCWPPITSGVLCLASLGCSEAGDAQRLPARQAGAEARPAELSFTRWLPAPERGSTKCGRIPTARTQGVAVRAR